MSRLDFAAQTPSRPVDASSSRGAVPTADVHEANNGGEQGGFDSLLEGLSKEQGRTNIADSLDDAGSMSSGSGEGSSKLSADALMLQALLSGTPSDAAVQNAPTVQPGNPAFSLLESLLPRVLAQPANVVSQQAGQNGRAVSPFAMASQQPMDEQDLMTPGFGPKMSISVQGQETHFRSIIESLGAALAEPAAEPAAEPINLTVEDSFARKQAAVGVKTAQPIEHFVSNEIPVAADTEYLAQKQLEEQRSASKGSVDRIADRMALQKQQSMSAAKSDGSSLPFTTLQQITRAIVDDAKVASGSHTGSHQGNGATQSAMVRASGGVLRVLNLQLNPVELGPMTIKMRLSGDNLEMELQVESEDTAELLRNDAEKLSSLLKVSGYHPDVINIQLTESAAHDRNALQRSPHGQQTQGQTFQQGAASGDGNPSHQRNEHQGRSQAELHRNDKDNRSSEYASRGGVYL
jgi:flagellar hook-length control protein FliK